MAGISFELKRLLQKKSLFSLIKATSYSAVLSSGSWVVAVTVILLFSLIGHLIGGDSELIVKFQVYVTYTIVISLILSGPLQLMFTRYVADRLFEKEPEKVLPNFNGALLLSLAISYILSLALSLYLFKGFNLIYYIIFSFTISCQCGLWMCNCLLTGLKDYKYILYSFVTTYLFTGIGLVISLNFGFLYLAVVFYIGQALLLFFLMRKIMNFYPSNKLLDWDFLKKDRSYYILALVGFFYNLAIWIDKVIFWFSPTTGYVVMGNIRASIIYDLPVLLSYLALIPGIAVSFLNIEVEFAKKYDDYYNAVRWWGRLSDIYKYGNRMIIEVQSVLYDTLRIQGIFMVIVLLAEEFLFKLAKVPFLYIPLFNILLIGSFLQLCFMVIFAILSYFDKRLELFCITITFYVLNLILTFISQILGPYFYGYGYAISLLLSDVLGMILLRRFLDEIHYKTFMLHN